MIPYRHPGPSGAGWLDVYREGEKKSPHLRPHRANRSSRLGLPMPDYSSSPQTGGGCDLTRSTYVFPCIQDARHWLVVQLGPGQGKTEHCTVQHGFHVFANVQCCFDKNIPLHRCNLTQNAVSWTKRTTKEDKRGQNKE